ncbi:hypothetical protein [Pseudobacter ginsenosidimutans]|uniref:hypothetical protein n=1 Tax=Pseudobacter ginsenosidimutans TaxID=661488 RepID=UPI001315287F|nr:hypothetical protein [Pseudobacter ginsenosidimutans]
MIYQIPNATAIDCIIGNRFVYTGDSTIQQSFQVQLYTLNPARDLFEVSQSGSLKGVYKDENLVRVGSQTMIIIDSAFHLPPPPSGPVPPADLLLISHNPYVDPYSLLTRLPTTQVVVDGSNSAKLALEWRSVCREAGIPCHFTAEKGAFVLNAY